MIAAAYANGYEAFAWTRWNPAGYGSAHGWVQARLRLPDGRLSSVQSVSASSGRAFLPVIGVDRAGDATVAWLERVRGLDYALEVSVRPAGGRFSPPVVLGQTHVSGCCGTTGAGTPGVLDAFDSFGVGPALAVAPDGAAVVAWEGVSSMQAAVRPSGRCPARSARACFSATQSLPPGRQPQFDPTERPGPQPQVVFGAHDRAFLVWASPTGLEVAVTHAAGQRFGAASHIASGSDMFTAPSIALAGDGSAVVAWHWLGVFVSGAPIPDGIAVAVRDPAGALGAPRKLAPAAASGEAGAGAGPPSVLIDPHGQALIDWQQGDLYIEEAVRATNGTIGATRIIGTMTGTSEPIVMDARGDTVLSYDGVEGQSYWMLRPPGGTFGAPTPVPGGGNSFLLLRTPTIVTLGWNTKTGTVLADINLSGS
ncbi:MAG TPA: hypothetical protein VN740_00535 [Solirubrobacteraceae bacterium]|nr:hypothetical protein [Solirubrobacteraceae bacterium]